MGWTGTNYDKRRHGNIAGFFKGEFGPDFEIIDSATVKRATWYAAVHNTRTDEVFGVVILLQWGKGYYNIHYKDMDESMGPVQSECPERILKILDARAPLPVLSANDLAEIERLKPLADYDKHPYNDPDRRAADQRLRELDPKRNAREWRARCWALIHARQQAPKVKVGDVIRFEQPINLTIGSVQEFRVGTGRSGKGIKLHTLYGIPCRIGNWRDLPYTIVEPAQEAA